MSMSVTNNISALKAHRSMSVSSRGLGDSIAKLSSGYRINTGADDPSGLVISEQLRSQIAGLERAVQNSTEAYNLVNIAEGALNEINSILKSMRALAIHSASNGVTSPEQIEANQAEMDSGIQTINRIAATTKYSDQFLLNGSKELVYDINTVVNGPTDHKLVDAGATRVDHVFKRKGVVMSIGYVGALTDTRSNAETSAKRAYLEADPAYNLCQLNGNAVTATQKFILTGNGGSKSFSYAAGAQLGMIVADINNSIDSTGVGASLIFASDARIDVTGHAVGGLTGYDQTGAGAYTYAAGDVQVYGAGLNNAAEAKISGVEISAKAADAFTVGYNCDGDGKIYAKVVDVTTNSIEYYKDVACTMLVGTGTDTFFASANNSGLPGYPVHATDGVFMTLTDQAKNLDVYEIAVVGQSLGNQKDMHTTIGTWADLEDSVMSGVNLGVNTSSDGQLFYKYTPTATDAVTGEVSEFRVEVFKDSERTPESLVATSGTVFANGAIPQTVRIESVTMDNGRDSGLNITMNIPSDISAELPTGAETGTTTFTNVGIRLYATEYGSDQFVHIQNQEGQLFYYYREDDTDLKTMISGEQTVMRYGSDAVVTVNGTPTITNGLTANISEVDFSGAVALNAGELGLTTVAVTGYDVGKVYSKAGDLQSVAQDETNIMRDERFFEPQSISLALPNVVDKNGYPLSLYLDFSVLKDSVLANVDDLGNAANVSVSYNAATMELTIDCDDMTTGGGSLTSTFVINPTTLANGMEVTEPELAGLYVKMSGKADTSLSANQTAVTGQVTPEWGNPLVEVNTYATTPRGNTADDLSNFVGGMQFQLGNSSGDQDRTVYSIQSMDITNLGRYEYNGRIYTVEDLQGSASASLARDPVLAMMVIEQAINDVTGLRARLGAFQKNMLQTNTNNLEVAIENLTSTESAIRDTDMAAEMTEYTKQQVLNQTSTSMLAQANQMAQNVLSLLQ